MGLLDNLIDQQNPVMDIVNSVARGAPQAATGLVDLASLPFTASGLLKPGQAVGSTEWLTQHGLLPKPSQSLAGQTVENLSAALVPVAPIAAKGLVSGIVNAPTAINQAAEQVLRSRVKPVFNTEVAVTNPALLQNVGLDDATGMALSRERLNAARSATGSPYAQGNMSASQGAWQGSNGFEANPVFMQELPASKGRVVDQDYMKYAAQTSENLTQDGNGVARFIPHLLNEPYAANAAMITNITPEQLKKLGKAGLTQDMVIAARPGNKALVMGFDDSTTQIPALMDQIKGIVPGAKFKTGISNNKVDRIYMERNPQWEGIPPYSEFGAQPRASGLLDTLDDRLRAKGNQ